MVDIALSSLLPLETLLAHELLVKLLSGVHLINLRSVVRVGVDVVQAACISIASHSLGLLQVWHLVLLSQRKDRPATFVCFTRVIRAAGHSGCIVR